MSDTLARKIFSKFAENRAFLLSLPAPPSSPAIAFSFGVGGKGDSVLIIKGWLMRLFSGKRNAQ